ncbi:MAG: dTMP kinase [Rikenellaceae bacterium]
MFIVIEGLDGAGKSTQLKMIIDHFNAIGVECLNIHFPRFETPIYGELIAKFLRGELGELNSVNPYLVALIYAGDRAEAAHKISEALLQGKAVILDRYIYSNIAFQCAKCKNKEESVELSKWIFDLEYNHNHIPKPDISIFLDVPMTFTKKKLEENRVGDDRGYLKGKQDIHEASLSFQERVREAYLTYGSSDPSFKVINCCSKGGDMLPPDDIFALIKQNL